MKIVHPKTKTLIDQRNALLQKTMRPEPLSFSVTEEYPIVLAPDNFFLSHCVVEGDEVIAHANLWPRTFADPKTQKKLRVGLVGNVATAASWQQKGIMAELLTHLKKEAKSQGLDALILWSDLDKFYQKQGYTSLGAEKRLFFRTEDLLKHCEKSPRRFFPSENRSVSEASLEALSALRYRTAMTLERSLREFKRLLTIPATRLYQATANGKVHGFCIAGKGYDMAGVIHEWGAASPADVLTALRDIGLDLQLAQVILLCPEALETAWLTVLQPLAERIEDHPMALAWNLTGKDEVQELLDRSFIWGLDSI